MPDLTVIIITDTSLAIAIKIPLSLSTLLVLLFDDLIFQPLVSSMVSGILLGLQFDIVQV